MPAGVKVGLGPSPNVGRRPTNPQDDEDTGEGPPLILRISLEFPDPDDPETAGVPPTMSAAPFKSNLPPDLRDALPTALEHSMTDLVNGPDTSWMEDAHAGQGRIRPIGTPSDDEETKRANLMATFEAAPALAAYRVPGLLDVYLRNRWLQEQLNPTASATSADLLDHYLEEAVDHAGPELATAAAQALANLPDPLERYTETRSTPTGPKPGKGSWSALSIGPAKTAKAWWEWAKSSGAARFGARVTTKRRWR